MVFSSPLRLQLLTLLTLLTLTFNLQDITWAQNVNVSVPQASTNAAGKLVLVRDGKNPLPIVLMEGASPRTHVAAQELADYIEKTAGVKPELIEGRPDPMPRQAIWVGYQPALDTLFPKLDFKFKHPEEILIAANENHLVIAGRDVWDPLRPDGVDRSGRRIEGVQKEYGTINAVYTFLRDGLGVRWLWPGDLGEDVLSQKTLAFEPFMHRYHPQLRMRENMLQRSALYTNRKRSSDWARMHRVQLDSLEGSVGGHGYNDWWEKYHQEHPEYFALQLDGTRSLVTKEYQVKLCHSNPAVWRQWVDNVAEQIALTPEQNLFNASPGDSGYTGHCFCENCKAWDHPDGIEMHLRSGGTGIKYVSLTDRHIIYANKVARMLKERFPDRNDYVVMQAYGANRAPPVAAKPDDNVLISNVANFFWGVDGDATEADGSTRTEWFTRWGDTGAKQIWRPNTGSPAGWTAGLPDIPIAHIIEATQFAAKEGAAGIFIDCIWEYWGTQGPLYYALSHVLWDPQVDWHAVMDDYYQRGFGPAAQDIKAYWTFLEEARNRKVDEYPGEENGYEEVYNDAFYRKAYDLLDSAAQKVKGGPEKYAQRIAFVRAGLDHTQLASKVRQTGAKYFVAMARNDQEEANAAIEESRELWNQIKYNCDENPIALDGQLLGGRRVNRPGLFHLDFINKAKPHHISTWKTKALEQAGVKAQAIKVQLQSAQQGGWELVFHDTFDRETLGDNWQALAGEWEIRNGKLHGMGSLISTMGFPGHDAAGFQRMEFTAIASADLSRVSDMSSLLHTSPPKDGQEIIQQGYFFQFGAIWNKSNRVMRHGKMLVSYDTREHTKIQQGKKHVVVVENNEGQLNMFVDGLSVLTTTDKTPFVGEGFDRVGFYFYTPFAVDEVKVYVKRLAGGLDEDQEEVN